VAALANPLLEPVGARHLVEGAPIRHALGQEDVQSVAELGDEVEAGKLEERPRIAPVVELAAEVEAHARLDPAQLVVDAELAQVLEGGLVGRADEVVVTLDLEAVELG